MSATAEAWLTIPDRTMMLGAVRWSRSCDALEDAAGQTVALTVQLEQVFDGLFSYGPAPHFAYVIGLLRAMKFGGSDPQYARLHAAYTASGNAAALARNAGVLIGELCADLPWKHRPSHESVLLALQSLQRYGDRLKSDASHEPPLPLTEALPRIAERIQDYSDEQLSHWFRFGRESVPDAKPLEEVFDSLPVRVLKLLTAARLNPRLIGAASLVPVLDAAITFPPRKQSPEALPLGGYADVTTRGDPDRLLPSQFALDPDDFVRRFAERELLYFKREEPHTAVKPERVIVLDQGVRTWGRVRLALAGAALSLLKADARRLGDVRVYFTATRDSVDLCRHALDSLLDLFAASDLTPHPTDAFVRALTEERNPDATRDIVLLTHPNNLHIPLMEAKGTRRPTDRIFVLSVQDDGGATLDELLDEGPRTLRTFKLDLAAAEAVRIEVPSIAVSHTEPARFGAWIGDVEPIGFPFRPGLLGEPKALAFSAEGESLAILSRDGLLHRLSFDGSPPEVLPRAYENGNVLKTVEAVLGVTNGIVVFGKMRRIAVSEFGVTINSPHHAVMTSSATYEVPDYLINDEIVVAHYDFISRKVNLYRSGIDSEAVRFCVHPSFTHAMIQSADEPLALLAAIDLQRKQVLSQHQNPESFRDLDRAWDHVIAPPYEVPPQTRRVPGSRRQLVLEENSLWLDDPVSGPWMSFEPLADGKPLLAGKVIAQTRLAGNTLAIKIGKLSDHSADSIVLFRGPEGNIVGEFGGFIRSSPLNLTADGTKLARCFGKRSVGVNATHDGSHIATASPARLHDNVEFDFEKLPMQLRFKIGYNLHTFSFQNERLQHRCAAASEKFVPMTGEFPNAIYDRHRFPMMRCRPTDFWKLVQDRWGAMHLLTRGDQLVASFLIRRDKAAAWIPDGTFWGDASLIGGPAHPDADHRIYKAILDTWQVES